MDPMAVAGMIFTLIFTILIGGFILLFPVTRRLGLFLESKLQDKKSDTQDQLAETQQLRELLRSLEAQVKLLNERQEFTEQLLSKRGQETRLPPAGEKS